MPRPVSAVDEGRNPYGLPGHGNMDKAWAKLNAVPCPDCGATCKTLVFDEKGKATVTCHRTRTVMGVDLGYARAESISNEPAG